VYNGAFAVCLLAVGRSALVAELRCWHAVLLQIKEPKWSDRAAALDKALDVLSRHVRIAGDARDYGDVVAAIKLCLPDANQTVRCLWRGWRRTCGLMRCLRRL
jgi:hypothetical protein